MATLVDLQPLMIVSYVTIPDEERDYSRFRNAFFDRIFGKILEFTKSFGPIVLCAEGGKRNWRKDFYPEYKGNRHKDDGKDKRNWAEMYEWFNNLLAEIKENSVFRILQVENAEADDIIGLLAYNADVPTLIVSSDKDFQQCQVNSHVKQWSTFKKEFITCEDPRDFLIDHIVRGDSADNIPSIRKELYKEGVPRDTGRAAITKKFLAEFKQGLNYEKYAERYKENKKLIDLTEIPSEVKRGIVEAVGEDWKCDTTKAINYFKDNGMGKFAEEYILFRKS